MKHFWFTWMQDGFVIDSYARAYSSLEEAVAHTEDTWVVGLGSKLVGLEDDGVKVRIDEALND